MPKLSEEIQAQAVQSALSVPVCEAMPITECVHYNQASALRESLHDALAKDAQHIAARLKFTNRPEAITIPPHEALVALIHSKANVFCSYVGEETKHHTLEPDQLVEALHSTMETQLKDHAQTLAKPSGRGMV